MGRYARKRNNRPALPPHTVIREFSSIAEFAVHANKVGVDKSSGFGSWSGGSFTQALERANKGWPEGREMVERAAERIRDYIAPVMKRAALRRDVAGTAGIDIGAYCEGRPDCLLEYAPRLAKKPIRIHASVNAQGDVAGESLTNRGAAILAAIECLTQNGYAVELVVSIVNSYGYDSQYHSAYICKVKSHGESLDVDSLAFALANPGMPRQLGFNAKSGEPNGYGSMMKSDGYGHEWTEYTDADASLYMPRVNSDREWGSEESAAIRMLALLADKGIGGVSQLDVETLRDAFSAMKGN